MNTLDSNYFVYIDDDNSYFVNKDTFVNKIKIYQGIRLIP